MRRHRQLNRIRSRLKWHNAVYQVKQWENSLADGPPQISIRLHIIVLFHPQIRNVGEEILHWTDDQHESAEGHFRQCRND